MRTYTGRPKGVWGDLFHQFAYWDGKNAVDQAALRVARGGGKGHGLGRDSSRWPLAAFLLSAGT